MRELLQTKAFIVENMIEVELREEITSKGDYYE